MNANLSSEQGDKLQAVGKNLLLYVYSMMKTGEIHDLNNEAWLRPSEKLNDAIRELLKIERRRLTFLVYEGVAQVNNHALWLDKSTIETAQELERLFAQAEIGGIVFREVPKEDTLRVFFFELARYRPDPALVDGFESLRTLFIKKGVSAVSVTPRPNRIDEVGTGVRGVRALWTYGKSVAAFEEIASRTPIQTKEALSLAQQIIDSSASEQDLLVALALSGGQRSRTRLAVDSAILTTAVSRTLGLRRRECCDLVMTALMSFIGSSYQGENRTEVDIEFASSALTFRQLAEGANLTTQLLHRVMVGSEWNEELFANDSSLGIKQTPLGTSILLRSVNAFLRRVHGIGCNPELPLNVFMKLAQETSSKAEEVALKVVALSIGFLPVGTLIRLQNEDIAVISEIDYARGTGVYGAPDRPLTKVKRIYAMRLASKTGQPINERHARVLLGDIGDDGEWGTDAVLSSLDHSHLVISGVFGNPALVKRQMGL